MQTTIVLSALIFLGLHHMYRKYRLKTKTAWDIIRDSCFGTKSVHTLRNMQAPKEDKGRFHFWLCSLSDFHKAQCFYSIALQIASFVTIYGHNKNQTDDMFLLLISADGIIPVAIALYTLLLLGHAEVYDIALAGVSALVASITGFSILLSYSSVTSINGAVGPLSCGGPSPKQICNMNVHFEGNYNPNIFFAGGAIMLDILICSMILGYCLSKLNILDNPRLQPYFWIVSKIVRMFAVPAFHLVTVLILLAYTAIELFFFVVLLEGDNPFVSYDWSFGQVVGITIWSAFIADLIRYEMGMSRSSFFLSR